MRIYLIGMPGSGKSYWMRQLAAAMQFSTLDMDHYIQGREQAAITELFAAGEAYFREKERKALEQIIDTYSDKVVIATGGGTPCYKNNMQLMKQSGCVIYLESSMEHLLVNINRSVVSRPLLINTSREELPLKLADIYEKRKEIYEQAHIKIEVHNVSSATFVASITQYISSQNPQIR